MAHASFIRTQEHSDTQTRPQQTRIETARDRDTQQRSEPHTHAQKARARACNATTTKNGNFSVCKRMRFRLMFFFLNRHFVQGFQSQKCNGNGERHTGQKMVTNPNLPNFVSIFPSNYSVSMARHRFKRHNVAPMSSELALRRLSNTERRAIILSKMPLITVLLLLHILQQIGTLAPV